MKRLLIEAPLNTLSFGNVSYNILRELAKTDVEIGLFPVGNTDLGSFEPKEKFVGWLRDCIDKRWELLAEGVPTLKLWHLSGGENRKTPIQNLLTFYECSEPTNAEVAVAKSQNKVLLSSSYAQERLGSRGVNNSVFVPMGFDKDFFVTNKKYLDGVVHFGLMGKFEKRKHTANIIQAWAKAFGNDNNFQLTCCITNPFFKPEQMQAAILQVLGGKRYTNINFLPYLKTNAEVNELLNAIDIDLTGLSGGEGWNLPSFNATCLGKWSVVLNETSHKDWATSDNSILIPSNGTMPSADGFFFAEGQEYNQGVFYTWDQDVVIDAMKQAVKASSRTNVRGIELGQKFTYAKTTEEILKSFD